MIIINIDAVLRCHWVKYKPKVHNARPDGKSDGHYYDLTIHEFCIAHNLFKYYNNNNTIKYKLDVI